MASKTGRTPAVIDWDTADMLRDDPIRNLTPIMDVIRYRDEDWQ